MGGKTTYLVGFVKGGHGAFVGIEVDVTGKVDRSGK